MAVKVYNRNKENAIDWMKKNKNSNRKKIGRTSIQVKMQKLKFNLYNNVQSFCCKIYSHLCIVLVKFLAKGFFFISKIKREREKILNFNLV
jgi:hypothetical protein